MTRFALAAVFVVVVATLAPAAEPVPELAALERRAVRPAGAGFRWQEIPWHTDAAAALADARKENRPLFVWMAGGRDRDGTPLERC